MVIAHWYAPTIAPRIHLLCVSHLLSSLEWYILQYSFFFKKKKKHKPGGAKRDELYLPRSCLALIEGNESRDKTNTETSEESAGEEQG